MSNPCSTDIHTTSPRVPVCGSQSDDAGDRCWCCRAAVAVDDAVRRVERASAALIWLTFWEIVALEQGLQHAPLAGTILDMLLGPVEDFEYVSRTTPPSAADPPL